MNNFETTVNGLKVNYKIFGEGTPFLILHGWGSKAEKWEGIGELLVKRGFKVIIPDLPGFGLSQLPPNPWSLDDYCAFLEEFIKKACGELVEPFYLLGNSFGGAVAVKYALKHPEKIKKLFLVAAACIRKKTIKKSVLKWASKVLKNFSFLPFYSFIRKKIYQLIRSDYADFDNVMKETYLKVISEDFSESLSSIKIPTVIIWGDKDQSTPVEHAYLINKQIVGSKLIIIPGGTHYLRREIPEVLSQKILENL